MSSSREQDREKRSASKLKVHQVAATAYMARRGYIEHCTQWKPPVAWDILAPKERQFYVDCAAALMSMPKTPLTEFHAAAVERRLKSGWRLASEFSDALRTSPYLLTWDMIPREERMGWAAFYVNVVTVAPQFYEDNNVTVKFVDKVENPDPLNPVVLRKN